MADLFNLRSTVTFLSEEARIKTWPQLRCPITFRVESESPLSPGERSGGRFIHRFASENRQLRLNARLNAGRALQRTT